MMSKPPVPITTIDELWDRYKEYLEERPGVENPYPTSSLYIDALLLKHPQLQLVKARATDGKLYQAIRGIWLDPTTTAAISLRNKRYDKRKKMSIPYPTFKATLEYEEWKNKQAEIDLVEDYANGEL